MRTWGRVGETPVLRETFGWTHLSVIAGLTLKSFVFRIHKGSVKSPQVCAFLGALRRHAGGKILVVWDGAAIHRSARVREYVAKTKGAIWLERLPAYAPEINPVEYLWAHLKEHEICNLLARDGWELSLHATRALRRMRRRKNIIRACWVQAELPL